MLVIFLNQTIELLSTELSYFPCPYGICQSWNYQVASTVIYERVTSADLVFKRKHFPFLPRSMLVIIFPGIKWKSLWVQSDPDQWDEARCLKNHGHGTAIGLYYHLYLGSYPGFISESPGAGSPHHRLLTTTHPARDPVVRFEQHSSQRSHHQFKVPKAGQLLSRSRPLSVSSQSWRVLCG